MKATNVQMATMYVWDKNASFSIKFFQDLLGGEKTVTDDEFKAHRMYPMFFTEDFRIYTEQSLSPGQIGSGECRPLYSTPIIDERFAAYDLPVPEHEIRFLPRHNALLLPGVSLEKLTVVAEHFAFHTRKDTLLVPGHDVEDNPLYASPNIADKMASPVTAPTLL
jgi:hypothetical protein